VDRGNGCALTLGDDVSLDEVQRRWPEIIEAVAEHNEHAAALTRCGVPTAVDDAGRLVVSLRYPVHAHMLAKHTDLVERVLAETVGETWQARFEVDPLPGWDWSSAEVVRQPRDVRFTYTVGFPKDVEQRLEAEATRRGVNPIELIRELVTTALPPASRS
jgi:hypothetical protein